MNNVERCSFFGRFESANAKQRKDFSGIFGQPFVLALEKLLEMRHDLGVASGA